MVSVWTPGTGRCRVRPSFCRRSASVARNCLPVSMPPTTSSCSCTDSRLTEGGLTQISKSMTEDERLLVENIRLLFDGDEPTVAGGAASAPVQPSPRNVINQVWITGRRHFFASHALHSASVARERQADGAAHCALRLSARADLTYADDTDFGPGEDFSRGSTPCLPQKIYQRRRTIYGTTERLLVAPRHVSRQRLID